MKDDNKKPNANRQKKEALVAQLTEKVQKAKAIIFTNYQGMTHHQLEALKRSAKKLNAEFVITKNTLLNRSLKTINHELTDDQLRNPTATLFAYEDPITPLKELTRSIKALKLPLIKIGIFEQKIVSESEINKIAMLPSREMLVAQVVGGLKSPLYGLHRALNWNIQKLVMTLKAIEGTKA